MPEGPSIVILKELVDVLHIKDKTVVTATGNAKIDIQSLVGKQVEHFRSWGKHFLICFKDITVRVHFLLFGSYTINERKEMSPRLSIKFKNDEINFYNCSVKLFDKTVEELYDWSTDIMSSEWDAAKALKALKKMPDAFVCDVLLNQDIFAGVGNIIKNEVLFRIYVQPLSLVGALPAKKIKEMVDEARNYSFQFLEWKKEYKLREHWLAHNRRICPRCNIPFIKGYLGKTNRRSFYCSNCQILYVK